MLNELACGGGAGVRASIANSHTIAKHHMSITRAEAVAKWEAGHLSVIGEYRMSKAEIIEWRDKTNGQMRSAPMLRHTVEVGSASVTVNERVPDGTKLEDIHIPFVKGDTVVLSVDEWASAKGLVTCRGKLEKLQAGSPGTANPVGPKR